MIWNASYTDTDDLGANLELFVLSRDLVNGVVQANNCSARYATYDVGVTVQEHSTTPQLWNMTLGAVMQHNESFIAQLHGICTELFGWVVWGGDLMESWRMTR